MGTRRRSLMKQGGGGGLIYHSIFMFEISHNKNFKKIFLSPLYSLCGVPTDDSRDQESHFLLPEPARCPKTFVKVTTTTTTIKKSHEVDLHPQPVVDLGFGGLTGSGPSYLSLLS